MKFLNGVYNFKKFYKLNVEVLQEELKLFLDKTTQEEIHTKYIIKDGSNINNLDINSKTKKSRIVKFISDLDVFWIYLKSKCLLEFDYRYNEARDYHNIEITIHKVKNVVEQLKEKAKEFDITKEIDNIFDTINTMFEKFKKRLIKLY